MASMPWQVTVHTSRTSKRLSARLSDAMLLMVSPANALHALLLPYLGGLKKGTPMSM